MNTEEQPKRKLYRPQRGGLEESLAAMTEVKKDGFTVEGLVIAANGHGKVTFRKCLTDIRKCMGEWRDTWQVCWNGCAVGFTNFNPIGDYESLEVDVSLTQHATITVDKDKQTEAEDFIDRGGWHSISRVPRNGKLVYRAWRYVDEEQESKVTREGTPSPYEIHEDIASRET